MERRRIGRDLVLKIAIRLKTGEYLDPVEVEDLEVSFWHLYYKEIRMSTEYTISDGLIMAVIPSSFQTRAGKYAVTVEYNKNGVRQIADECPAVELIPITTRPAYIPENTVDIGLFVDVCKDGTDGATPYIGDNGNWWIRGEDTGKPSKGTDGKSGTLSYPTFRIDPATGKMYVRAPFYYTGDEFKLINGYLVMKL